MDFRHKIICLFRAAAWGLDVSVSCQTLARPSGLASKLAVCTPGSSSKVSVHINNSLAAPGYPSARTYIYNASRGWAASRVSDIWCVQSNHRFWGFATLHSKSPSFRCEHWTYHDSNRRPETVACFSFSRKCKILNNSNVLLFCAAEIQDYAFWRVGVKTSLQG